MSQTFEATTPLPRPAITDAQPWTFPTARQRVLDNGLQVWAFHLPGQHVVTATLVLDLPLTVEVPELEGIATMTLRTSDEGTREHPGQSIIDALESAGAAYEGGASASATICSVEMPSTRLAQALPLFAEIVQSPTLADADVERHVALRLSEIEQTLARPSSVAALAVRQVLFDPSCREARPQGGVARTVAAVTGELVRGFHERHWGPKGSTLVVAGDLNQDVDALVDECFGTWKAPGGKALHVVPTPAGAPTSTDEGRIVHLVDRPESVQTEIRVSGIGLDRTSLDFAPLQVAASAMGGSFGSRLNTELRERKGYTYGVHFAVSPARLGGTWAVSTSVRTEVAAQAVLDCLRIMELDEDFSAEEVVDAVNQQLGVAPLRYDTASSIASQAATLAAAGWDPDFVNLHFSRIGQVGAASASAAYRAVVRPENSHVVLVGDAAALRGPLTEAGFVVQELEVA